MVSKSALEQAEMMAEANKSAKQQQNATARRGLFMLLLAIIWGILKFIFKIIFAFAKKSSEGKTDISDWYRIK